MNIKKLLLGPNKYTTGLIFLLANMMGFFAKMKQHKVSDRDSAVILVTVISVAYMLS
jgi:hypothetical protein